MCRNLLVLSMFIFVAGLLCAASVGYSYPVSGITAMSADILTAATTGGKGGGSTGGTGSGSGTGSGTGAAYGGHSGYGYGYGYTVYYYLVTNPDGTKEYTTMTVYRERVLSSEAREAVKPRIQEWNDLRKRWVAAFPKQQFPVDKPVPTQYDQKNVYPIGDDNRAKWDAKHEAELEQYVVCVITKDGTKTAEAMRIDRVAGRRDELNRDYVEAALAEAAERKGDPDAAKQPFKTKRPELKVGKKIMSQDAADRLAAQLQEKIDSAPVSEPAETANPSGDTPSEPATTGGDAPAATPSPSEDAPSGAPTPGGG